nr:cation-translocating P-type ATPase [Bdellovibrio sp. HAGR004]
MKTISFENIKGLRRRDGGLTLADVAEQRERFGPNNIVEVSGSPWIDLLTDTLKDPMIWFLLAVGSAFFLVGEPTDGITLYVAIFPLLFMDAFLHWRTQASTSTLRGQLSSRVQVYRESREIEIDARDLVPGDLVLLVHGVVVPADGVFERTQDIQLDESVLTGESQPVKKMPSTLDLFAMSALEEVRVPSETLGYAGTRVLTGSGALRVLLTGSSTSYGEIVRSVVRMPHERTPLQASIGRLVQILVVGSVLLCLVLAAVRIYQGHGWLDALLSAATMAVAAMPEEFPVVFTFFLGVGVYRLAKKRALVRRAVSVENIGRITHICTDKTGTITHGRLTLTHWEPNKGDVLSLLRTALAASSSDSDPVDTAIRQVAQQMNLDSPLRLRVFPFTEDRKRETVLTQESGGDFMAHVKGSPERILAMSGLAVNERALWGERVSQWARTGHKVIGVAKKRSAALFENEPEGGLEFCGLLAFEDPARPEVADAMAYCRSNGIRVLMITGDHPETSAAIAKDAGLTLTEPVVVSAEEESEKFQEEWLNHNAGYLKTVDVVARCTPMQKLRIVMALKRLGELVAVTGDGVNDVPALKAADIGIAMGERGSRSAKEVSSIILADDNFSTIINAIREGRQLFLNLKMSFEYLLLLHVPLVLTAAILPLAGYPLVYLPVHIVWLELLIHPTALLAFQAAATAAPEEPNNPKIFSSQQMISICLAGVLLAGAMGWGFTHTLEESGDPERARAMAMALLTFWSGGVALYLTRFKSKVATALALTTFLSSVGLIHFSDSLSFLRLSPLRPEDWVVTSTLVLLLLSGLMWVRKSRL